MTRVEFEEAKLKYEKRIETQKVTLEQLKHIRQEIEHSEKHMEMKDDEAEIEAEKVRITNLKKKYQKKRHEDDRLVSHNHRVWKEKFIDYLELRGDSKQRRGGAMAFDILLSRENGMEEWALETVLNVTEVRDILQRFKQSKTTNDTNKIIYVNYFECFILFLTTDISSPEYAQDSSNDIIIAKDIILKKVTFEIYTIKTQLSKNRGRDIIKAREKAKSKLIDEDDKTSVV